MEVPDFRFLSNPEAIAAATETIAGEGAVAFDLEADSLHSYVEKVCLIQISTSLGNLIVDPLPSLEPLQGLAALFADEGVLKVFHGGSYDIRLLKKDFGFEVRNVFDTMIASQFTGRGKHGLAALLDEDFGVTLDKRYQRADWSARPLSPEMLEYAAMDTAYLLPLRDRLEDMLRRLGRLEWAREEFRLLEETEPSPRKKPWCLDVKGARRLAPRQLAHLQAFLELRDETARSWDKPPFKVLSNQVLIGWSQQPPASKDDVLRTAGASRKVLAFIAAAVVDAARRAASTPIEECPRPENSSFQPLTEEQKKILRRLKKTREKRESSLGLPAGIMVNSATLETISRLDREEAESSLGTLLKIWQQEAIGEEIRAVLRELPHH
jgi:ribonuclease D